MVPPEVEVKLGFDQIRIRLKSYCLSTLGQTLVDRMRFSASSPQILQRLRQNHEFKQILELGESFPSTHYFDPSSLLAKASIEGAYLEEQEFLQLAWSMQTIASCKHFLVNNREKFPSLFLLADPVILPIGLIKNILSVVDESGIIKDSASTDLSKIRKRLREEHSRLRKLIDQVYRWAVEQRWVPDGALPTIRGGRLVIPILAEYKRKVKGFIQDESATGQTVFMEPAEVLESNNEIRDLEHAEKREVIRILKQLTDSLRSEIPQLETAYEFLSWVDFTRAKGKLALEFRSELPQVLEKPALKWMKARHPLLELSLKGKHDIVPLNIDLNETKRMLLVSGPNAGGKSVCLKTVGLLQYMLQCGLLIPVSPDSTTGIFDHVFIDIGDQQSIENDLSTYSSHLKNMADFMREAGAYSLVLLDELGSGTDPNFGGAIAQAVLNALLEKKIWGIATTHYYNLKLFAGQQPGIRNAAMRFDEEKLMPLYVLDIGKPGSSFALEIAKKTGIPPSVLSKAQQLVGSELLGFDSLIRNLEKERNELTEKVKRLERQDAEAKMLKEKYDLLLSELTVKKKLIIEKAKEEARQLLNQTNREIEKTIRHIRENQAQKGETRKVRQSLEEIAQRVSTPKPVRSKPAIPGLIKPGDRVRIVGQEGSGIVLSVKGKSAIVQLGEMKTKVDIIKLENVSISQPEKVAQTTLRSIGLSLHEKRAGYTPLLDVRGKRAEEVVPLLEEFLDSSVLLAQHEIRILHGKGEGVLRKIIREHLKKYKQVASFADEHVERGGDGITVVVLK